MPAEDILFFNLYLNKNDSPKYLLFTIKHLAQTDILYSKVHL